MYTKIKQLLPKVMYSSRDKQSYYSLAFNRITLSFIFSISTIICLLFVNIAYSQSNADIQLRAGEHPGFGRMVLDSSSIIRIKTIKNKSRSWTFMLNKAIISDVGIIVKLLPNYVEKASLDQSGLNLTIKLRDDFKLEQNSYGTAIIFDWLIKKDSKPYKLKSNNAPAIYSPKPTTGNGTIKQFNINRGLQLKANAFSNMGRITFWGNQQLKPIIKSSKDEVQISFENYSLSSKDIYVLDSLGAYIKEYKLKNNLLILKLQKNIKTNYLRYLNSYIVDFRNEDNNVRAITNPTATQLGVPIIPINSSNYSSKPKEIIKTRLGEHPDFIRLVFDWPYQVNYLVEHINNQLDISFSRRAKFELPTFPKSVSSILGPIKQEELNGSSRISFAVPQSIPVVHQRFENKIILDIRVSERNAVQDLVDNLSNNKNNLITGNETLSDNILSKRGKNKDSISDALAVLYFDWIDPVGAALFQHRDTIWIVFDSSLKVDVYDLIQQTQNFFKDVQVLPSNNSTVIRLVPKQNFYASIEQLGFTWLVRFDAKKIQTPRSLNINVLNSAAGYELHIPTGKAGKIISIIDPITFERLIVGTLPSPGYAINKSHAYPGLQIPVTQQGVLALPQDENIDGISANNRFIFYRPGGLAITPFNKSTTENKNPKQSILDFAKWDALFSSNYGSSYIITQLTLDESKSREEMYKEITSQYLAHGFYPEALGSAKEMESYYLNPTENQDPEALLLMTASAIMRQDKDMMNFWINREEIKNYKETDLWRGIDAAINKDWQTARSFFNNTETILDSYSKNLKSDIYLLQLQSLVETNDREGVDIFLNKLTSSHMFFTDYQERWLNYLRARAALLRQQTATALNILNDLVVDKNDKTANYSKFMIAKYQVKNNLIDNNDAIAKLENIRISWRGDDLELKVIQLLAQLYSKQKEHRTALKNYRQALTYFSSHPLVFGLRHDMLRLFRSLFSETENVLPVIELLNLYNEFRELVPSGPDGNRLSEVLADHLYFENYFDQSKDILKRQFDFRLQKDDKRRIAIKLAIIYLALNDTVNAEDILNKANVNNLSLTDIRRQDVQLLQAYLLASKNDRKGAVTLLSGVINLEADLLRRDIALKEEDWSSLILALERLTGPPPEDEDIILPGPIQRHLVTWAIALNRLNDKKGLKQLEKFYLQSLPDNNIKVLFSLLTSGSGTPSTLLKSMQNLDILAPQTSFISLLRNRYFSS